ncbi:type II secretion system protein N [Desulforhopalus sp. 52FAK]
MQGRSSNIVILFLITIFSIISVEGFYQALEYFVFQTPVVSEEEVRTDKTTAVASQRKREEKRPDYRIILQRNLFGRPDDKRAPEQANPAEETAPQDKAELGIVLMGTISGSDNSNRAFILTKNTREQELFSIGEVVEGALIKDIQRGKLVLSIDGKDAFLDMSEAAEMRARYVPPKTSTKKSARSATLGGNNNSTNINSTTVPRRRVVRRPRATQNSPRSTEN